jgi:hypothetical protein
VFAGFQYTAADGLVALKPDPSVTNLISPGASGSDAEVLLSTRIFQPFGAWAIIGATATAASTAIKANRFIGFPP